MQIPEGTTALEIGNIRIQKDDKNRYFLSNTNSKSGYIDEKGNTSWDKYKAFENFEEALKFAREIIRYFNDPIPAADIESWYEWIKNDEESEDFDSINDSADNAQYREFASLMISQEWGKAYKLTREMDTFIREGISDRIWFELEKNLK